MGDEETSCHCWWLFFHPESVHYVTESTDLIASSGTNIMKGENKGLGKAPFQFKHRTVYHLASGLGYRHTTDNMQSA